MDRDGASQAQGRSRSSGGEERPQGQPPGARAGRCLGGRAGLIGVGGCSHTPQTPSGSTEAAVSAILDTPSVRQRVEKALKAALEETLVYGRPLAPSVLEELARDGVVTLPPENPGAPSVSEAPPPSDLWTPEALAELAALAEETLPQLRLDAAALEARSDARRARFSTFWKLTPPCASAAPAGGEPALKE